MHVIKTGEHKKKTWLKAASLRWASGVHYVANEVKTEYTFYLKCDFLSLYSLVLFRIGAVNRLMQVLIFVVERKKLGLLGKRLLFNSRKRTGTLEDFDKIVQIILETWKALILYDCLPLFVTTCSWLLSFFIKGHGRGLNFFHGLQTFKCLLDPSTNV